MKEKQSKLSNEIKKSRCLYKDRENKTISNLINDYELGKINKYRYILKMHSKYLSLFELKDLIKTRLVKSILIDKEFVVVHLEHDDLRFILDKSCRSPVIEMLNFGSYESNEMQMFKNVLKERDVFFDVGAHFGWYSICLAKHFKNVQFYAFEPVLHTYNLLNKNIEINELKNIKSFNFGFSDKSREAKFYYSEIGSAIASEKDIFDMDILNTIKCQLVKMDDFVNSEKIMKIDVIKCDVEGAEFLVIKGGEYFIRNFLPVLFLELVENWCIKFDYTIASLRKFLFDIGYEMFEITGNFLTKIGIITCDKIDNYNYIFLHAKKHKNHIDTYAIKF